MCQFPKNPSWRICWVSLLVPATSEQCLRSSVNTRTHVGCSSFIHKSTSVIKSKLPQNERDVFRWTSNKSRVSTVLQSLLAFQLRFGEPLSKNMFSYNCWHRTLFHNVTVGTAEAISGSVCRRVSSSRSPKVSHLSRTLPVASVNPNNNILDRANTCSGLSSINPFVS